MTNCKSFSANAIKIFEKIQPYFPPDPWSNPQWIQEGRVKDNEWYDLRKSDDRSRLIEAERSALGHMAQIKAVAHREKHGSLRGFAKKRFSRAIQHQVELLLLLEDLDFQIESLDFVESV